MNSMQETRAQLAQLSLPKGDNYELKDSPKRFSDGAQYRFEVPGIQGPAAMKALLEQLQEYGLHIHRVTQTKGIWTLTDEEIKKMVALAEEHQVQLM